MNCPSGIATDLAAVIVNREHHAITEKVVIAVTVFIMPDDSDIHGDLTGEIPICSGNTVEVMKENIVSGGVAKMPLIDRFLG